MFYCASPQDAFFCIPVHHSSQYLFVFEWTNPCYGQMQQYTWMVLPPGVLRQPTLVRPGPRKRAKGNTPKRRAILQYVDILICSPTMEASDQSTIEVLNFLGAQGYRVSQKKKKKGTNLKTSYISGIYYKPWK